MPYYKNETTNILFIHIPKTGGTVLENEMSMIFEQQLYAENDNDLLPYPFNKISLHHQFYSTIYNYRDLLNVDFNNIKIFAFVRNPYTKIVSDLFFYKFINENNSQEEVYSLIKNEYIPNDLDNHNIPQYKFLINENNELVDEIKIFKTENLNICNEEINNYLGVNINLNSENANKDYFKYLNKDSINLINDFYDKDFKLFNYEKILYDD
jgi:hypothetical protein